jgi:hypothetical protein
MWLALVFIAQAAVATQVPEPLCLQEYNQAVGHGKILPEVRAYIEHLETNGREQTLKSSGLSSDWVKADIYRCVVARALTAVKTAEDSGLFLHDNAAVRQAQQISGTTGDYMTYRTALTRFSRAANSAAEPAMRQKAQSGLAAAEKSRFGFCFHYAQLVCDSVVEQAIPYLREKYRPLGLDPVDYFMSYHLNAQTDPSFGKNFMESVGYLLGLTANDFTHNVVAIRFREKGQHFAFSDQDKEWIIIDAWNNSTVEMMSTFNKGDNWIFTTETQSCPQFLGQTFKKS